MTWPLTWNTRSSSSSEISTVEMFVLATVIICTMFFSPKGCNNNCCLCVLWLSPENGDIWPANNTDWSHLTSWIHNHFQCNTRFINRQRMAWLLNKQLCPKGPKACLLNKQLCPLSPKSPACHASPLCFTSWKNCPEMPVRHTVSLVCRVGSSIVWGFSLKEPRSKQTNSSVRLHN